MSEAVAPGAVLRVIVDGNDIVVWRGSDGAVRAWENRCPHRGMRLSYGFVRGNRLTCLYHGWGYDGQGSCVSIPAHPTLTPPKTIKVARYDCVEGSGLVWVAPQGSNEPLQDVGGAWLPVQTIDLPLPADAVRSAIAQAGTATEEDYGHHPAGDGPSDASSFSDDASEGAATSAGPFVMLTDARSGRKVLCAVQAVSGSQAALHILVSADGGGDSGTLRRAYAKWGRRFRVGPDLPVPPPGGMRAASAASHASPLA